MTPAETAILPRLGVVFSRNLLTMICTMGLFAGLRHRISLFQNDICCLHAIYLGFYMLAFMLNLYLFQRNGMKSLPRKVLLGCTILSFLIYVLGFVCTGFIALIEPKALLALSAAPGDLMAQIATTAVKEESAFTAGAWPLNLNIIIGDALVAWRAWAVWSDRKSVKIILMIMAILNALLCIADAAFDDATLLAPSSIEGTPVPIDVTTLAFSFALNLAATSLIGLKAWRHHSMLPDKKRRTYALKLLLLLVESGAVFLTLECACMVLSIIVDNDTGLVTSLVTGQGLVQTFFEFALAVYPLSIIIMFQLQSSPLEASFHLDTLGDRDDSATVGYSSGSIPQS